LKSSSQEIEKIFTIFVGLFDFQKFLLLVGHQLCKFCAKMAGKVGDDCGAQRFNFLKKLALLNETVDIYTLRLWRTFSAGKVQAAFIATLKYGSYPWLLVPDGVAAFRFM
jgi:hypothetical protein